MRYLTSEHRAGKKSEELNFQQILDCGISDMREGRELPLEKAFQKVTELRDARRNE